MTLTMRQTASQKFNNECSQMRAPTKSITLDVLGYDENVK